MAELTEQPKRPRGNPNLQKKKQPSEQNTNMAKEEGTATEDTTKKTEPQTDGSATPVDKLPDDLFSDKIPGQETLPLDGVVVQKAYASLNTEGSNPPPPPPKSGEEAKPFDAGTAAPTPGTPLPPAAKPLTPEEINSQAQQMVDTMFKGYEKVHQLGRWIGKIDENELSAMQSEDKVDLNITLPVGKKEITFRQFFAEYNESIEQNISISEKFKTDLTPPLTRIVIKNNLLMSDELYVGMAVADDLVTKTSLLFGLKKSCGLVLKAAIDLKSAIKAQAAEAAEKKERPATIIEEKQTEHTESDWHQEPEAKG